MCTPERQSATDSVDLLFLNDIRAIEAQIARRLLEFAKAERALASMVTPPYNALGTAAPNGTPPSDPAYFVELKNRNDKVLQFQLSGFSPAYRLTRSSTR